MGISAGTVWEVRAAGSDANGGLFCASQAGAGTDYSQQDSAQLSLSDVVTNGSTTVTSATGGFTSAMVGNGINIAGTCCMIATRSSTNSITVDRTLGAATGQTAKVGGALGSPGFAAGQAASANTVWIKAGTFTLGSGASNVSGGTVQSPGGSAGFPFLWQGYQSARGDHGTKPVIADGAINSVNILEADSAFVIFDNIEVATANSGNVCIYVAAASVTVIRCRTSGPSLGIYLINPDCAALFCEGANTTNYPFKSINRNSMVGCVAHGSSTDGFHFASSTICSHCISYGNTGSGFAVESGGDSCFVHCTAYGNGADGFSLSSSGGSSASYALNCIATGNGAYGFNAAGTAGYTDLIACATYSNTSGATHNLGSAESSVTLTGDPFVNAGSGNFGLNATAGAGASCRAAGLPAAFPGLAGTIGYPDLGAVQHQASASGGAGGGRLALSL